MRRVGVSRRSGLLNLAVALALGAAVAGEATAKTASLDETATERVERRRLARSGQLPLPLPGTPDTERPLSRLATVGLSYGNRVLIRVFKAESEMEVWIEKDRAYAHFATYPICYFSGGLGPKFREGDRQAPEGFYTITARQLHFGNRWRRSLDIGFPNVFDRVNGRTGSGILIHGGCDSVGCFAMTDGVSNEIYDLVSSALRRTAHVPVHVFPFRMTDANIARHTESRWTTFWDDLKAGYEAFERTRLPPRVSVCGRRYRVDDAQATEPQGVEICPEDVYMTLASVTAKASAETAANVPMDAKLPRVSINCSMARASCRRWVALRDRNSAGPVAISKPAGTRARSRMR